MPYYRRRTYRRKRRYSKGERNARALGRRAGSTAYQALRTARYVKSLLNVEYKHHDLVNGSASIPNVNNAGLTYTLNLIPHGDTTQSRDGRQCKMKSIYGLGRININTSATHTAIRCYLIYIPQTQGAGVTTTTFFDGTTNDALRNLDNAYKFRVLWSRRYTLSTNKPEVYVSFFKKLSNLVVFEQGAASPAIADTERGLLQFIAVGDEAINTPSMSLNTRLRFIDN